MKKMVEFKNTRDLNKQLSSLCFFTKARGLGQPAMAWQIDCGGTLSDYMGKADVIKYVNRLIKEGI